MLKRILLLSAMIMSLGFVSIQAHAQEALCAEVKIEILQELTMERQGFEALMRITNSLDSFSLENVSVTVNFADANGNPVVATSNTSASNAAFFIRIDDTRDLTGLIEGVNGQVTNGTIAPKKVGELRWLIIPTANAAGQIKDGKLYFVGAQLRYSYGGKEEVVDVAADSIVVKPQPALTLDYFLTEEITGDDAFTTDIEPPVPYTLGVRINNTGYGYANAVKLESAQPTIVENELGLAVDFKILSSYLGDQPAAPTLLINFGTIDPQAVTVGRWVMETNLAGKFTAFTASFTHADELGGELTSLLQATNAHFLVRDVVVTLPGRDSVRDFLAYNPQRDLFVYESENTGLTHALCNHCAAVATPAASLSGQSATSQLTHAPQAGFSYAKVADPFNGTRVLSRAVRADGAVLNPRNAWLSKERAENNISFNYFINVFDSGSSGAYTLHWGGLLADEPQPPVIHYIADRNTYEGGSLGFLVQASDPNNTIPNVSVNALPTGARFTLQAPNIGVLQWNPTVGQAGIYPITFAASDGSFVTERSVTVRVNPHYDIDGDGMDDAWELEQFGDLDNDGTGDADGDGRSDLQEFLEGTNPTVAELVPGAPQIHSPIFDAETLDTAAAPFFPTLSVTNANHGTGIDDVVVIFEVYSDEGLTDLVASATAAEGDGITSVQLAAEHLVGEAVFTDNRLYYWRARARDNTHGAATQGALTSAWVKSRFFINTTNDAPSAPGISSPVVDGRVADVSPELIVTNATDIDRDRLYYHFVVYEESNLTEPLVEVTHLAPGADGQTRWRIPRILQEDARYLWQVTVTDEHGVATTSEWGSFLVSTVNDAPSTPTLAFPLLLSEVNELEANNGLTLRVNNAVDPERAALVYYFELDQVNTFDSEQKQVSEPVSEGQEQTAWLASELLENTAYFWRVRASDGSLLGPWVIGEFTVSADNEAPSVPTLQNPVVGSVVPSLRPLLEINPAVDPEGTALSYEFELYVSEDLTGLVADYETADTFWALEIDLTNTSTYYWRARAKDSAGVVSPWSHVGHFTVSMPVVNEPPQMSFVLPTSDITVENNQVLLQWVDSDPDSSATISLFRHVDGGAPILIVAGLSEDADSEGDQYLWDTTGLAAGDYTISAVIADEDSSVTVNLCCVITVPEVDAGPVYEQGLRGHYYGHQPSVAGWSLANVQSARAVIASTFPDATFIATQINYAHGEGSLGRDNHALTFLGADAESLTGNVPYTDTVVLHFNGKIALPAGSHRLRVRSDDGYSVLIGGNIVAQFSGNQAATTRTHDVFTLVEGGLHDIDIVYWDGNGEYQLSIELSSDGGSTYQYLDTQRLFHDNESNLLPTVEPETVIFSEGLLSSYFSYSSAENEGILIGGLYTANAIARAGNPDAQFVATLLNYSQGYNDLGRDGNLQLFLNHDAVSLTADPRETDNAVIHMEGKLTLNPGIYNLRVKADDGYRVLLNGAVIAEYPRNQAAIYRVFEPFTVSGNQPGKFEIIYWDASQHYELGIEISADGGATYQYLHSNVLSHQSYQADTYSLQRSSGQKLVIDHGGDDAMVFGAGISAEQLWFSKAGSDLVVDIIGTEDSVRIKNWYLNQRYRIETFELNSGDIMIASDVPPLVEAMSALVPPALGEFVLSPAYLSQLEDVIAAGWQPAL